MFLSKSSVAGYILSFGLTGTNSAGAAVIFDALGNGDVCAPSDGAGSWNCNGLSVGRNFFSEDFFGSAPSNTALAASFTIPSGQSYSLESIALSAGVTQGGIPSAFRVDIKESAADGSPGSSIFFDHRLGPSIQPVSFGVQPTPQVLGNISSTQNVTLSGGSTYWLSLSLPQPVSAIDSQVGWFWNLNQPAVTGDLRSQTLDPATGSIDQGSAWRTASMQAPAFRVEGLPISPPPPPPSQTPKAVIQPIAPTIGTPADVFTGDETKPTVIITHGWQPTLTGNSPSGTPEWVQSMTEGIGSRANVVQWNWDDATTGVLGFSEALAEVRVQGEALGEHLHTLVKSGEVSSEHIQLIGHSLGTLVNAYAANYLTSHGITIEQVTILDRPFGNGLAARAPEFSGGVFASGPNLDEPIFQTLLKKDKVIWVDNYFGNDLIAVPPAFGAAFENAIAQNTLIDGADHGEVHDWYACTIIAGDGCQKLITIDDLRAHSGFLSSTAGGHFADRPDDTGWDPGDVPLTAKSIQVDPITWLAQNCLAAQIARCTEGSPAYIWDLEFHFPEDSRFLSFDFRWSSPGDGDFLTLQFGDGLLFNYLGQEFQGDEFRNSGLLPVSGLAGMTDQLLFALNSVGDANASFEIGNLQIFFGATVGEPGTGTLIAISMGLLFVQITRRETRAAAI